MITKANKRRVLGPSITERQKFVAEGRRMFLTALNKQIDPFINNLEKNGELNFNLISTEPIEKAMLVVYGAVGAYFAQRTLNSARKSKSYRDIELKRRRRRFVRNPDGTTSEIIENETWLEFMKRFAQQTAGEKIRSITDTTLTFVRGVLDDSIQQGYGIEKTVKALREKWEGLSKTRARRIAQTEIIGASNSGSYHGALATGLDLDKIWLAKVVNSRPDHLEAHHQRVAMNDSFIVGGEEMSYPGDPRGSAKQVVSCHCSIVYEVND